MGEGSPFKGGGYSDVALTVHQPPTQIHRCTDWPVDSNREITGKMLPGAGLQIVTGNREIRETGKPGGSPNREMRLKKVDNDRL